MESYPGARSPRAACLSVICLGLWLAVTALPLAACDPVLLDLIRGRDRASAFDEAVEGVSTRLQELAALTRFDGWDRAPALLSRVQQDWVKLYSAYYLSEPPSEEMGQRWRGTFDSVAQELADLEGTLPKRDFDSSHVLIRGIQDRLIRFYRKRAPDSVSDRFLRVAELTRTLDEQSRKAGIHPGDLGSTYLHLEEELRELPPGPEELRRNLMKGLKALHQGLGARENLPEATARFREALEIYRQKTLEELWFRSPAQKGKETDR